MLLDEQKNRSRLQELQEFGLILLYSYAYFHMYKQEYKMVYKLQLLQPASYRKIVAGNDPMLISDGAVQIPMKNESQAA
jgi:hypothetical protein